MSISTAARSCRPTKRPERETPRWRTGGLSFGSPRLLGWTGGRQRWKGHRMQTENSTRHRKPASAQMLDWAADNLALLSGSETKVLVALMQSAHHKTGRCFLLWETIARRTGLSRPTVARALAGLEEKTLIARKKGRGASVYSLAPDISGDRKWLDGPLAIPRGITDETSRGVTGETHNSGFSNRDSTRENVIGFPVDKRVRAA